MHDADFPKSGRTATWATPSAQNAASQGRHTAVGPAASGQQPPTAPRPPRHNPLRPHLVRPGNGRGFWQRVGALFGLVALVGALGLLLAGLVVVVVVGGAFLLETLID